jgi:hypothetical protein
LHAHHRRGRGSARRDGQAADVAHAFGKTIAEQGVWEERVANARIDIEMTRLLCLKAADMMDRAGNKAAQGEIAMIKVAAPIMALKIIDDAIQAFGAAGVSEDAGLARTYASIRTLRLADGPDEVHRRAIAGWSIRSTGERAGDRRGCARRWLEANVEGFCRPFELTKFPSGQSNPTYRIARASGDYVLRAQAVRAAAAVGACGRPRVSVACGFIRSISRCRAASRLCAIPMSSARSST